MTNPIPTADGKTPSEKFSEDDILGIMEELHAKSWQAQRYKASPNRERKDHVCARAEKALRQLLVECDHLRRKT